MANVVSVYLPSEDLDTFKLFLGWTVKEHLGNGPDMPTSPKIWELDTAKAVKMLQSIGGYIL
jgi:hypothetical protein